MPSKVDVLIVGAGPTGLTLACELKRRGLAVRIIDKLSQPTTQSRALGLQARSLDIFEKIGVLDKILDQGLPVDTVHLYKHGKQIGMYTLAALPIIYPFVIVLPQADTEIILSDRLQQLGGRVERNVSFQELEEGKAVIAHASGETETVLASWIIGCDGAHSLVRHSLNIPFKGTKFSEYFVLADVAIPDFPLQRREIHAFLSNRGILGMIPLPRKNHFRLLTISKSAIETNDLTIPFWNQLVQERTTRAISIEKIIWASTFTVHRRIVSRMSQGSVFLCGDAAHIHSPAGGQGLNIGIQDAFNLGWKLALVIQGIALPELLATYQEERLPVARRTLWGTTFATFFISAPYPLIRNFFFKALSYLFRSDHFRRRFGAAVAEVNTHYKRSRLSRHPLKDIFWKGPKPGHLAPLLQNSDEPRFILLVFGSPDYKPELSSEIFNIQYFSLESTLALPYRVKKPCLYLIRPDGYIAYRSRSFPHNLGNLLKRTLFLR